MAISQIVVVAIRCQYVCCAWREEVWRIWKSESMSMLSCISPWSSGEVRMSLVMIEQREALNICPTPASDAV